MASNRRTLPPGARWVTLPSGERRVELVVDVGANPATGARRQTRRRYRTADEAIDAYAKLRSDVRAGTYVGRSTTALSEVCDDWLAGRRLRAGTLANYRNSLKPFVRAYGALSLEQLTKRHIDDLVTELQAGRVQRADGKPGRPWKPATVNLLLTVLRMIIDDAMKQGLVVRNVAHLVDRVPVRATEMQTYSSTEVRTVLARAKGDPHEHAWHLALTGLRRGEVCGLRWTDVDLDRRTLTIRESRVSVDGRVVVEAPKTERGNRTLPLPDPLASVLARARTRQAADQLRAGAEYQDSGYVVRDTAGRALHPETVSDYWDRLTADAGVKRIRLHDARHTCGTLMHLQGEPAAVIAAWLGHANAAFTMRTYVHSQDEAMVAAARRMGSR